MTTKRYTPTELRAIYDQLIHVAYKLGDLAKEQSPELTKALNHASGDLFDLARRLDVEISITPQYTGAGNEVIRNMLRTLNNDFYRKFEALADAIDPDGKN